MTLRTEVKDVLKLGSLPDSNSSEEIIREFEKGLMSIVRPLTADEGRALLAVFGSDDCFGLAWTLIHLIETAPQTFSLEGVKEEGNEWIELLARRRARSKAKRELVERSADSRAREPERKDN